MDDITFFIMTESCSSVKSLAVLAELVVAATFFFLAMVFATR
jgi:hypothetical protein